MKKTLSFVLVIIMLFCFTQSNAKEKQPATYNFDNKVYLGLNIGFGFFSPGDVNAVLKDEFTAPSGYYLTSTTGFSEMILNVLGNLSLFYRLDKNFEFQLTGEGALGPKMITLGSHTQTFYFNRYGPGLLVNFHLPVGVGRHSVFFSPGVFYNIMSFDNYNGSTVTADGIGLRFSGGYSMSFGSFNPRVYIGYDYSTATDKSHQINGHNFELNYSGFLIGVYVNFMLNR